MSDKVKQMYRKSKGVFKRLIYKKIGNGSEVEKKT